MLPPAPVLLLLLPQAPAPGRPPANSLEAEAGWHLLFDGRSLEGWRPAGRPDAAVTGWEVRDGTLHLPPGAAGTVGGLVTRPVFRHFELEFAWRVAPGGNSGVKYRVSESPGQGDMTGLEYQILDDTGTGPGTDPRHLAGALYDLAAAGPHPPAGPGVWHHGRIVLARGHVEHWLDGLRLLRIPTEGPEWSRRVQASKFRGVRDFPPPEGPIGLQDHGSEVWFRDLRIRDLDRLPGGSVELFDGRSLAGWRPLGDARWTAGPDGILGETGGGHQSFLATEAEYGDFLLELELRNEAPGNSGIQVRSHERADGRLVGYQVEVDPSPRAWSGGLYDEARRGWLDDLADDPAARAAFRPGQWNHYRIECLGPWIRTWVNGVPAADHFDPLDLAGGIGLQVHAGQDTRVRWRGFRMRHLGIRHWQPLALEAQGWRLRATEELGDFTVHLRLPAAEAWPRLRWRHRPRASDELVPYGGVPGLRHGPAGWLLDLTAVAAARGLAPGKSHDLWVMAYGDRLALNVDGTSLAQLRGVPGPRAGMFLVEWPGEPPPPDGLRTWLLGPPR